MKPNRSQFEHSASNLRSLGYSVLAQFLVYSLPLTAFGTAALFCGCDAIRPLQREQAGTVLEAAVFEGGYGTYWHKATAEAYSIEKGGTVRVRLWGDPRVVEKVKPRILRGDPPDLLLMQELPVWLMAAAGKLRPWNEALAKPPYGSTLPWGELFLPGTLETYKTGGKIYAVPSVLGAWCCWYDAALFRQKGWSIPKTWTELVALCERIRAEGIYPFAYQGKYPYYGWWTFVSLIQRCGGLAAINRINAMEPGAFQHPDVVWAARLFQEMGQKYFQPGALAMTHTESQLEFIHGRAAMIFCGIWLYNEMKASVRPEMELRAFSMPAVEGGKGNPALIQGAGTEWLYLPTDGKNPEVAMDFARYMISPERAPSMSRTIHVISPLRGATRRDDLVPPLQSVLDLIESTPGLFNVRLDLLLLEWNHQIMQPSVLGLLRGDLTPEEFCRRLDEGIAAAKRNPDLLIPDYTPYDAVALGEVRE